MGEKKEKSPLLGMCRNYHPAGFSKQYLSLQKTVFVSENSISGFIFPSGYDEETEVSRYFLEVIDSAFKVSFTYIHRYIHISKKNYEATVNVFFHSKTV